MAFGTMENRTEPCVVIVVEDEALIRMSAVYAFEDADFAVLEAGTADEAIEILEHEADSIHVVFTDVRMPGSMDGVELAHHIRQHWPHIGLIAASGHARRLAERLPHGSRFVAKPYDLDEVVSHVRELAPDACH
jgi:CheY-like chemotaxis protein